MSNRRKLRTDRAATREVCTSCGRSTGRYASGDILRFSRTGQVICPRCQQTGSPQRMACGHYALPGSLIVNNNGDGRTYICARCAEDAQRHGVYLGAGR